MAYKINEIVDQMGKIALEGNIIPNQWYSHLKNEKGKTQTNAALILADIVYWYRPIPIHDINSGEVIGFGKKFQEDLLQLNYKYFNNKFNLSEVQIRNALVFLEEKGLIFREFRNIVVNGYILNNVMFIGIVPEKIFEISGCSNNKLPCNSLKTANQSSLQANIASTLTQLKPKEKDWSSKFSDEEKAFLDYLMSIKPEIGNPVEKIHATWWIKHFGIEKIKIALQVYWQRVEKSRQDSTIPMPQHIGKYVRKALNEGLMPIPQTEPRSSKMDESFGLKKQNQGGEKKEPAPKTNITTNTQISMTSLLINEVNDKDASLTCQKNRNQNKIPSLKISNKEMKPISTTPQTFKKELKKSNKQTDWKETFTSEEKKFLSYLLRLHPEKGDSIEEKHATWWIKEFGIEKIKIALQVYWQQVEKAKKNNKVPMPISIGAYVREALNKGIQPCRENDRKNRAFAEQFKAQMKWSELTITEKYCRIEEFGKEWHFNLPEAVFIESLKNTFENFCCYADRQSCVA